MTRRPLAACALLFAVYLGLSLLNDPRGYLGTDTGGKVATLKVMAERDRLDPDIGYWAEEWDSTGRVHPLYYTSKVGARWVNVTTLPMLYAGYPLYELGGYRLALVLPMIGSVLAALAVRALAGRLGATAGAAWKAFWVVGLASPLTIYALDFWEHSLGVAAMAWALVLLLDVVEERGGWLAPLAAGALFGSAATLRTESLVYALVAVGLACLVLLVGRRRLGRAIAVGVVATAGLIVPLAANVALERATIGDAIRVQRASGTARVAVADAGEVGAQRVEEAILNAVGLTPLRDPRSYLEGAVLLALLAFVSLRATISSTDTAPAALAASGVAVLYATRFAQGPGFVPGLVAATPIAAAGLFLGWSSVASRYLLGVGLVALPLVWATQFQGGAAPQWAGRYLLVSGLVLSVVGLLALSKLRPWAATGLVVLAAVVTGFGLLWTSIRTKDVAGTLATLSQRPEPVLVSRIGHLAREGGAFYGERDWLTAPSDADEAYALGVLMRSGTTRFALVELATARKRAAPAGWRVAGRERLEFLSGFDLRLTSFEAVPGAVAER